MRTRNFQPVQYNSSRNTQTGVCAVAAVMGMVLSLKDDDLETPILELADGKAGLFLDRDIVANKAALQVLVEANELRPNKGEFEYPYVAGGAVTAQDFDLVWVEGAALHASMDVETTIGQQVTTAAGKITELTNSETQECLGVVRKNMAAINTTAPARRFLIEVIRAPKNVPAV